MHKVQLFLLFTCFLPIQTYTDQQEMCEQNISETQVTTEYEKYRHCPHYHCPTNAQNQNSQCSQCQAHSNAQQQNEKEVQQLAIATLVNMAQGILNIGCDPHNPQNVANNVTNIVGNFANFVAHAMSDKSINIEELLNDEEFLAEFTTLLINKAEIMKKSSHK